MREKTKLLLEENNRAEEALSEKGQTLLTNIVVYLRGSRISTWEQEQVCSEHTSDGSTVPSSSEHSQVSLRS